MRRDACSRTLSLWDATRHGDSRCSAVIAYRRDDPFAVALALISPDARVMVDVVFARELLIDGLAWPTGEGVVRVEPHYDDPDYLIITLPVAGGMRFYAERSTVEAFLDASYLVVPLGGEVALAARDLDRWLAEEMA